MRIKRVWVDGLLFFEAESEYGLTALFTEKEVDKAVNRAKQTAFNKALFKK